METLDIFLRAQIEPLQYAAFFGAMFILLALECFIERSPRAPERKKRWSTNFGLTVLNIIVLSSIPLSGIAVADYARANNYGLLNLIDIAPIAALVIGILFRSFISYGIHFTFHKVPLLWRIHRVHHTDTFLDVSTTVRMHPLEFLLGAPVLLLAALAMGISPVALLIYELFDASMSVFTHANIRMPKWLDRTIGLFLVTPDMHRVHHSSNHVETDSNYGATLSIWDRMFGTYTRKNPEELANMEIGLREVQDERATQFWWHLLLPFRATRIPRLKNSEKDGA